MTGRVRSWIKVRFITGFFVTVPIVVTAYVLWLFYSWVDGLLGPVYEELLHRHVPALGFLTAAVLLFLIGLLATNVVGRRIVQLGERLLLRVPLVRRVYPTVKELVEAFSPGRQTGFREFVLIEHPREGCWRYGFVTGGVAVAGLPHPSLVSVYVPTNHLYLGDIVLVASSAVAPTGLSIEEGIRIILSMGAATPPRLPVHGSPGPRTPRLAGRSTTP
jgi:uncharacterized membrane protein